MEVSLQDQVLNILITKAKGLKATEVLAALASKISQPTLWRALESLRARGSVTVEGHARATRYHARERTDVAALRSRLMHEAVAKLLVRKPALHARAFERLSKLRDVNPHGRRYHDRWLELLQGPSVDLLRAMTEASERSDALRKESPWSVFITASERQRIFASTRS